MKRHEISENNGIGSRISFRLNSGIPWRDLPERFGPWQSVYSRFRAWAKAGVWEDILTALIEQELVDETTLMLDSTTISVWHRLCWNLLI